MVRLAIAVVLAVAAAQAVDVLTRRRGLDPPGFRHPHRRALASVALAFAFLVGIFGPAVSFDQPPEVDFESLRWTSVFFLQALLLATLGLWAALGYLAVGPDPGAVDLDFADPPASEPPSADFAGEVRSSGAPPVGGLRLFGLWCRDPVAEVGIGLVAGFFAWLGVLLAAAAAALVLSGLGGGGLLADEPPEMIVWMASLPVAARLMMSLGAGVVEELFFRGFLQLRVGVGLSSLLFICGHLGYGQPFMLFGLTLLSLFYAFLVRWRRSIWAAVTAHFLFDAVQLLVVIPAALELYNSGLDAGSVAIC